MKKGDIDEFYRSLAAKHPEPKSDLNFINTYTLLVAVVLSAQATDTGVNKATKPLFKKVDSAEKMVAIGEAKLKNYIKMGILFLGLANTSSPKTVNRRVRAMLHVLCGS